MGTLKTTPPRNNNMPIYTTTAIDTEGSVYSHTDYADSEEDAVLSINKRIADKNLTDKGYKVVSCKKCTALSDFNYKPDNFDLFENNILPENYDEQ